MRVRGVRSSLKLATLSNLLTPDLLVKFLLITVSVEFVAVRILSRVGPVPQVSWILEAYQAMLTIGSLALTLAAGLAILLGFLFIRETLRSKTTHRVLAFSFLVVTLSVLAALIQEPSPLLSVAYSFFAVLVILSLINHFTMRGLRIPLRLAQLFTLIAACSVFYFKLVPQLEYLSGASLRFAHPLEVFLVGEGATLIATIFICYGYLRQAGMHISNRAVACASLVTGAFVLFFGTSSWLLSIIAMWTLGFTMFLPFPIYAVVLFLFVYTVAFAWSRNETWFAAGMLLLFFAGRFAQLGYLSMLMILGLVLISFPGGFRSRKSSSEDSSSMQASNWRQL